MAAQQKEYLGTFVCPICSPCRSFTTQLRLRNHVAEKHSWRDFTSSMVSLRSPLAYQDSLDSLSDEVFSDSGPTRFARKDPYNINYRPQQRRHHLAVPAHENRRKIRSAKSEPDLLESDMRPSPTSRNTGVHSWYDSVDLVDPPFSPTQDFRESDRLQQDYRYSSSPSNDDKMSDAKLARLNEEMKRLAVERRELSIEAAELTRNSEEDAEYLARLRQSLKERERGLTQKDIELRRISTALKQRATSPESHTGLDKYLQNLHARAASAERNAHQLREAICGSRQGSSPTSLPEDPSPPARHMRNSITSSRSAESSYSLPMDRRTSQGCEEIIRPVVAKRQTAVPRPIRYRTHNRDAVRKKNMSGSCQELTIVSPKFQILRNNQSFSQNLSDSGLDSASNSKNIGPVFVWPEVGMSSILDYPRKDWGPPRRAPVKLKRGPVSTGSSITSTTDDERSGGSSSLSYKTPAYMPPSSPISVVQNRCESLAKIFSLLDTKSLALSGRVCREWYHVSRQPHLWQHVRLINVRITPRMITNMTRWCTQVTSLSLENIQSPSTPSTSTNTSQAISGVLESGIERFLKVNSNTLKWLKFVFCGDSVTDRVLWLASVHCPYLEKVVFVSQTSPVTPEVIWSLGRGCPNLTHFVAPPACPPIQKNFSFDRSCQTIGQSWPLLQVLCIGGRTLTEDGLMAIARSCPKLSYLELDHGPEITESIAVNLVKVGLRGLERLDFTCTPVTPRAIIYFNSACPKLRNISVIGGISDYFKSPDDPTAQADFVALINLFQKLKSRPGFSDILRMDLNVG